MEISENLLGIREDVLPDFFLIDASSWVDIAHEECSRNSASEVAFVGSQADDLYEQINTRGMMKLLISFSE